MIAERLSAQLLTGTLGRATAPVVGRLLAVQAQDPRGARLAIRARTAIAISNGRGVRSKAVAPNSSRS